jgi:hypothetical protein
MPTKLSIARRRPLAAKYRPQRPIQLTKFVPAQLVKSPKHYAGRGSYV